MSSTPQSLAGSPLAVDADRDAEALHEAIGRIQTEARRDATLTGLLPAPELDRVVESTVRDLWHDSPIKTFVPVLALRLTREAILAGTRE
jgi:hypothetical protein